MAMRAIAIILAGCAGAAQAKWSGKGELGYVAASGNTDSTTLDAKLHLLDQLDSWSEIIDLSALRASTSEETATQTTAERYVADAQTNVNLTTYSFWFGDLQYRDDELSGFQYQSTATTGYGYAFFDSKDLKLSTQLGIGYARFKTAITGQDTSSAAYTARLNFEDALTASTRLIEHFEVVAAMSDTLIHNFIGVEVKVSDRLALSVGYDVQHNSSPPPPKETTDQLTTVNLLFAF
jgi:putative salt-induced outer membrane protein